MSLFEQASRDKLRVQTTKGVLTIEDLWDLPLTSNTDRPSLDGIARALHKKLSDSNVSFVESAAVKVNKADETLFEIVKHVINVRQDEAKAARDATAKKAQKERIREILAERADKAFEAKSDEELTALLASL